MKRLSFIKLSLFAGLASRFSLFAQQKNDRYTRNTITFFKETGDKYSVRGFMDNGLQYISVSHLATFLADRFFMNEVRKKLVLVKNSQRITFTVDNTFLKIDENFYQLFFPPKYVDNEVWVPVEEFVDIMTDFSSIHLYYGTSDKSLSYESKGYTITGVEIDKRDNGAVIQILTTKRFKRTDIRHVIRGGRLHVTIRDAQLNENGFSNIPSIGVIRDVKAHQLEVKKHDGSVSYSGELVFNVLGKVKKENVSVSINSDGYIIVGIHTKMSVSEKKEVEKEEELVKEETEVKQKYAIDTIVIDAGHGGKDPGAVGKLGKKKIYEKTVVLDVALKLKKLLLKENPHLKVVLTRTTNSKFVSLAKRGLIANNHKGKLFVSLHCNGNNSSRANGFEVYILGTHKDDAARNVALKENESIKYEDVATQKRFKGLSLIIATMKQNAYVRQSLHAAGSISRAMGKNLRDNRIKSRGVKQAGFYVLFGPSMPSILIELAFISNKREVKVLASKSERTKMAASISKGITQYKRDVERSV